MPLKRWQHDLLVKIDRDDWFFKRVFSNMRDMNKLESLATLTRIVMRYFKQGLVLIVLLSTSINAMADDSSTTMDPYENYNRHAYRLNDSIDRNILKPVAKFYKKILPKPV